MENRLILVRVSDRQWTLEALHLAGALAWDTGMEIVLLKMIPAGHPMLLGEAIGSRNYSVKEQREMENFAATLQDYGVLFECVLFQYVTLGDAIVDAAEQLGASVVFATLPREIFTPWRRLALWNLRRRLRGQGRMLYTLETPLDTLVIAPTTRHEVLEHVNE